MVALPSAAAAERRGAAAALPWRVAVALASLAVVGVAAVACPAQAKVQMAVDMAYPVGVAGTLLVGMEAVGRAEAPT